MPESLSPGEGRDERRDILKVRLGYCDLHGWSPYEELENQPAYCQMPVGPEETCALPLHRPTHFVPASHLTEYQAEAARLREALDVSWG